MMLQTRRLTSEALTPRGPEPKRFWEEDVFICQIDPNSFFWGGVFFFIHLPSFFDGVCFYQGGWCLFLAGGEEPFSF